MAVAKKPRRNNESNRRQELLRASARLFRQKGFDGTSIRDISSAAGMQSGSPFYHFKTKQDILVAVMEEGLTEGLRITSAVMALALPPEDKLVRMIRTQLATILDDAHDFVPVLHYEWRALTPANRRRILALKDRYDALWQRLIDELQQAGHMPGDAQLTRLLILGAVNWTGAWYTPAAALARRCRAGCRAAVPAKCRNDITRFSSSLAPRAAPGLLRLGHHRGGLRHYGSQRQCAHGLLAAVSPDPR